MSVISYVGKLAREHKAEIGMLVLAGAVTYAAAKRHKGGNPRDYFDGHHEPEHFSSRIRTPKDLRTGIATGMLLDARYFNGQIAV